MKAIVIVAVLIVLAGTAFLSGFGGTAIVLPFALTVAAALIGLYVWRVRPPARR